MIGCRKKFVEVQEEVAKNILFPQKDKKTGLELSMTYGPIKGHKNLFISTALKEPELKI